MGVSSLVALGGIGIASFFFLKNRRAATRWRARFAGLHRAARQQVLRRRDLRRAIVQPIRIALGGRALEGASTSRVIDGMVNGVGGVVGGSSELLRRLQTGSVRAYAASLFAGRRR